jgi:hypothetical protein
VYQRRDVVGGTREQGLEIDLALRIVLAQFQVEGIGEKHLTHVQGRLLEPTHELTAQRSVRVRQLAAPECGALGDEKFVLIVSHEFTRTDSSIDDCSDWRWLALLELWLTMIPLREMIGHDLRASCPLY